MRSLPVGQHRDDGRVARRHRISPGRRATDLHFRPRIVPEALDDDDVDVRDWKEVIWAVTTRMDPVRDTTLVEHTPIDYLDFASPVSGLGGKIGLDATHKWPGETAREWGRPITMEPEVSERVAGLVHRLLQP